MENYNSPYDLLSGWMFWVCSCYIGLVQVSWFGTQAETDCFLVMLCSQVARLTGPSKEAYPCIISWKMDTNFWMLLSIGNRSEKVSKNVKFRYLYTVEIRKHGIYVWNRFHFERVEKALSRRKVLYICSFSRHFFRQRLRFFLFSDG